jgi:hypothetical protein
MYSIASMYREYVSPRMYRRGSSLPDIRGGAVPIGYSVQSLLGSCELPRLAEHSHAMLLARHHHLLSQPGSPFLDDFGRFEFTNFT